MKTNLHVTTASHGFSLLEVMITIAILSIGLLGLAGLQARAHVAEAESYSRGQAIVLMQEMADRVRANLVEADEGKKLSTSEYNVTTREFGVGEAVVNCGALTGATRVACDDLNSWHLSLQGAALGGTSSGIIRLARGCVVRETVTVGTLTLQQYVVTVAWAGRGNFGTVPADRPCGSVAIPTGRRMVSVTVPIADLGGV